MAEEVAEAPCPCPALAAPVLLCPGRQQVPPQRNYLGLGGVAGPGGMAAHPLIERS